MPPVFLITYTTPRTYAITYETEWICDSSYDCDRARASFQAQFPSTAIVRIEELDPC